MAASRNSVRPSRSRSMRVPLLVVAALSALPMAAPVARAGMEEGLEAARSGNFKKALSELLPLARAGNADAAYRVADLYRTGKGVKQDVAEAAQWYRVAAQRSHTVAQYNLAVLYAMGEGIPADMVEARHWFHLAAERGYAPAQYNLAVLHATGKGGPQNLVQAYFWLELAAAQDYPDAAKTRDAIAREMTQPQIAATKALVRQWREDRKKKTDPKEGKEKAK